MREGRALTILGIESSCDETSAAVVRDGILLSNIISSQLFHSDYGGIVPELASRAHLKSIVPIIARALDEAGCTMLDLDAVAATQGPGLIGSLLVGLNAAKGIALGLDLPFVPIHHIEAHLFSTFVRDPHPEFPFLGLVVSGGHTLLVIVRGIGRYEMLGGTIDDAAGEAFDKVAKMLNLGFPGGPDIDRLAKLGNPDAVVFPRPLKSSGDYRFSFSGIKTSVLYHLRDTFKRRGENKLSEQELCDICASFQRAVVDVLTTKTLSAAQKYDIRDITMVGGVSANSELASTLRKLGDRDGHSVYIPELILSTDNAGMVAKLASMKLGPDFRSTLEAPAFARIADTLFS